MNEEQLRVLNIIQQVLRGVITSVGALNPPAMGQVAHALHAFSSAPDIDPVATTMLEDLAQGAGMLSSVGKPRQ